MKIYHWFTFEQKDDYGRYIGNGICMAAKIAPFYKCYVNYKPNRKGGHRHNYLKNAKVRRIQRSKELRNLWRIFEW